MNDNPYARPEQLVDATVKRFPFNWVNLLVVFAIVAVLISLLLSPVQQGTTSGRRTQCKKNLKQIALALHNYHDVHDAFPPAYTVDGEGKALHSWRTLILPFLEQQTLYDTVDLTKPWDDPANAHAEKEAPYAYRCPSADIPGNSTTYCGVVGEDYCIHPKRPRPIREITDGTSNTVMVFEVSPNEAVPWMAPQDTGDRFILTFGPDTEFAHRGGTQVAMADGAARFVSESIADDTRRALMTIAGDEPLGEW